MLVENTAPDKGTPKKKELDIISWLPMQSEFRVVGAQNRKKQVQSILTFAGFPAFPDQERNTAKEEVNFELETNR